MDDPQTQTAARSDGQAPRLWGSGMLRRRSGRPPHRASEALRVSRLDGVRHAVVAPEE